MVEKRKAPDDYGALGDRPDAGADVDTSAYGRTTNPIIETYDEVIDHVGADIRRKNYIDSSIKSNLCSSENLCLSKKNIV